MLTCNELTDFLDDYLEDNLSSWSRMSFELHLALCPPCRHYLESYRQTIQVARRTLAPVSSMPTEPVPEALIQAILAARPQGRPKV